MADEPENLVLQLLRGIRADMTTKADLAVVKADLDELRAEVHSLRADVASDLVGLRAEVKAEFKNVGDVVAGIRRALFE